ncbi:MAG: bifunctional glutamate N-acetyltransferase/amino-acid acetyltransferase ArgJ [Gammaproteobacteria bacterium]|nr:bifunctional glutamate N-acetyltransferase/amino-acid acetyltransferase ArgJ [Gammaproteobacteria bacterium]
MPVNLIIPEALHTIDGVKFSALACGIKKNKALDLVVVELCKEAQAVAVFTTNKFCAAPVTLAKQHLKEATPRYLLINSGNANAGTGEQGYQDALTCCESLASHAGCETNQVLPFSTGVIAEALPVEKIQQAIPSLVSSVSSQNALLAAKGILTTDLAIKATSTQVEIEGELITIMGFAKGSGMIKPNMATMLGYVFTDAKINKEVLDIYLTTAVDKSFNAITVDGDTSTNDACVLVSTQQSRVDIGANNAVFESALERVFQTLAQNIIRDGEGATKFVTIDVSSAANDKDAKEMAFTIAHSPLVKTALFASDPNWGRILAAVGRAPVSALAIDSVDLYLGDECLVKSGLPNPDYSEEKAFEIMRKDEINISVCLNIGNSSTRVWTTDLSYDYVKINAEYRS